MCQRITCRKCGKPSFAGCGRHIESVLGDVPVAGRCPGHTKDVLATSIEGSPGLLKRLRQLVTGRPEGGRR